MLHAREKGEHLIETSGFNLSQLYRHASIWIHMCLPCGRVCTSQNPKQITFKAFFFRGRKGQNIHILIAHTAEEEKAKAQTSRSMCMKGDIQSSGWGSLNGLPCTSAEEKEVRSVNASL